MTPHPLLPDAPDDWCDPVPLNPAFPRLMQRPSPFKLCPNLGPESCISAHIAELVTGDHDLTAFGNDAVRASMLQHAHWANDLPRLEQAITTERTNYVMGLTILYGILHAVGQIEHTNDWDWYVGVTLRDGTRLGDGSYVYEAPTRGEDLDPDGHDAEAHGYCDTWHIPGYKFGDCPAGYLLLEHQAYNPAPHPPTHIVLEMFDGPTTPVTEDGISVAIADIATLTIDQR